MGARGDRIMNATAVDPSDSTAFHSNYWALYMKKRALIVGASGIAGSNLADRLVDSGLGGVRTLSRAHSSVLEGSADHRRPDIGGVREGRTR